MRVLERVTNETLIGFELGRWGGAPCPNPMSFSFVTLSITLIHTKKCSGPRVSFLHLIGAGPNHIFGFCPSPVPHHTDYRRRFLPPPWLPGGFGNPESGQKSGPAKVEIRNPGQKSGPAKVEIRNPARNPGPPKWKSGIRPPKVEIRNPGRNPGHKNGNPESGQKSGSQKVESRNPATTGGEDHCAGN